LINFVEITGKAPRNETFNLPCFANDFIIQAASRAERIALFAPVPVGQNGSTSASPHRIARGPPSGVANFA